MAKYSRRRSRRSRHSRKGPKRGLFGYVYGPVQQTLKATDNVTRTTANTLRDVISTGLRGVERVGRKVTSRADTVVRGLLPRRMRKGSRRVTKKNNKKN
jgi:hypothetical protein